MNMIFFLNFNFNLCVLCCRYDYSGYGQSSGKVCDFAFFVILFYFGILFGLDSGKVLVFIFVL